MAKTLARKLLLVRRLNVTADLIEKNGLAPFSKGKPIPVSPQAWNEEAGLSHWAYVLEGMKLKDLEMLTQYSQVRVDDSILDIKPWDKDKDGMLYCGYKLQGINLDVEKALADCGLRINTLAE